LKIESTSFFESLEFSIIVGYPKGTVQEACLFWSGISTKKNEEEVSELRKYFL